ncbi:MAG TPA: GYD family protein [Actinobacteria bacterium]|nr:GYD family protein [Actinomycetota bacterium]
MTTGVAFFKWTDEGRHSYRETVDRLGANVKLAEKFGVEIKDVFWTPGGPYDLVGVAVGPDAKTLTAFCLAMQSAGYLRAEWAEAYRPEEMLEVIAVG